MSNRACQFLFLFFLFGCLSGIFSHFLYIRLNFRKKYRDQTSSFERFSILQRGSNISTSQSQIYISLSQMGQSIQELTK